MDFRTAEHPPQLLLPVCGYSGPDCGFLNQIFRRDGQNDSFVSFRVHECNALELFHSTWIRADYRDARFRICPLRRWSSGSLTSGKEMTTRISSSWVCEGATW